jgi:hypothetical protein
MSEVAKMNVGNIRQVSPIVSQSSANSSAAQQQVAESAKQMGELLQEVQQKSNNLAEKLTKLSVAVDLYT